MAGPSALVLFGVTGDLARKKLLPAVYDLANRGLLPPGFGLVGFARRDWAAEHFAEVVADSVREHARTEFRDDVWKQLRRGHPVRARRTQRQRGLRAAQAHADRTRRDPGHRRQPCVLPVGSARRLRRGRRPAASTRARRPAQGLLAPGGDREAVRSRPGQRAPAGAEAGPGLRAVQHLPDRPLPRQGDGAEPAGLPVRQHACSSRSGTATTSTTCRSPWPRTSASPGARATTTASAPPGT